MKRHSMFLTIPVLFILISSGMGMAAPLPERDREEWVLIPEADWSLESEIIYLRDLQDSLQTVDRLQEISILPWPGHDYRTDDSLTGSDVLFKAAYLNPVPLDSIPAEGVTLIHEYGLTPQEFEQEIDGAADYIESLLGERPVTLAYPRHTHTRELMAKLRDEGWVCARDGAPHGSGGGAPTASFLLGYHSNPEWRLSWDYWSPWELPLSTGLDEEAIQSAYSREDMHNLLFNTLTYNVDHGNVNIYTYDYDSVVEMWLDNNTWVQVYAHGNPAHEYTLDGLHLGWLVDELMDDGRFWVDDTRTIGAYAHERHQPSLLDSLVYEPDGVYGTEPWNNHPCAFTFSTDDGRIINMEYADTLLARGVNMTVYVIRDVLDLTVDSHLSAAELIELHAMGNVEVGSHSKSHPRLIPEEALVLQNSGTDPIAFEIVEVEDVRRLRFYRASAVAVEEWINPDLRATLHPCYPNPSNPLSEITYSLPERTQVMLSVFDIQGRLVKRLIDDQENSGEHRVIWRGVDDRGESVPSGIYFARLEAGGVVESGKIVLLR